MRIFNVKSGMVSLASAFVASLCCVLPLTVVLLGIGSGAFMMTTMKYSYVFIPAGVIGVSLGYFLYFREKKKNAACGCPMPAGKLNLTILILATIVVVLSVVFNVFPGLIAQLFEG
jgi:uncharacterized membrane protein